MVRRHADDFDIDKEDRLVKNSFAEHRASKLALVLALAAGTLLGGCATSGNPRDPIEGFNRAIFDINDGLDKALIKPVAQGYEAALPAPVRRGVTNFFSNIDDVFIAVNNLLQGKLPEAISDVGRVAVNTTIGLLGVMDVATDFGLEKHDEDFGQTFGRWGVGDGPYLVLPLFGPSTVRDAFGRAIDVHVDPVNNLNNISSRNVLVATRGLNDRSSLLSADKIVEEAALDRYAYMRDAYLQRRRYRIYDGEPPREKENAAESAFNRVNAAPANLFAKTHPERVLGSANLFVELPTEELLYSTLPEAPAQASQPVRSALVAQPVQFAQASAQAPSPVRAEVNR